MAIYPGEYDIDGLVQNLPFSKRTIERKLPEWNIEVKRYGNKRIFKVTEQIAERLNANHANDNVINRDDIVHLKLELSRRDIIITKLTGQLEKSEALAALAEKSNSLLLKAKEN